MPVDDTRRVEHRTAEELAAGLDEIRRSPVGAGRLELIACRVALGERQVLDVGQLDLAAGLVGDNWAERGSRRTPDGSPHPGMQVTVMNARAAGLVAGARDRWALAGDQLYVDLHLGADLLPAGSRLAIGDVAVIEVTDIPHRGCAKFVARFGPQAMRLVNSETGRALNLRGINALVVSPGTVRTGDAVVVVPSA
ncbi:hypothetical protein BH20ACT2_BH20ACT2_07400 [soil metagenome]